MTDRALFEQAGGLPGIEAVLRTFYDRVFDDIMIGFMFRAASKERLIAKEVELTARLLGASSVRYSGKPMRSAHAPHRIMGGQFMRRRKILEDAMDAHNTPAEVRAAWLAHNDALRPLVTADTGGDCTAIALDFQRNVAEKVFIGATWLAGHLGEVDLVDVRWSLDGPDGFSQFKAGHIPGARFMDLGAELSGSSGPGRHPLPSADHFAAVLARHGISGRKTVVAYDDKGGAIAARLWWLTRYFGLSGGCRILDGGLPAWTGAVEPGDATASPVTPPALKTRADMVVNAEGVASLLELPGTALIDARAAARYRGEHEPIDPVAGHIPGASNLPFAGNLGPDGTMLPAAQLRARYANVLAADTLIAYCGSGVTACHNLAALATLGRSDALLYEGSWSDWCTRN